MNIRKANSSRRYPAGYQIDGPKSSRRLKKYFAGVVLLAVIILSWTSFGTSHASSTGSPVKSGWSGYCLDDYKDKDLAGNQVDIWPCNNSAAQDWQLSLTQIKHGHDLCLDAESSTKIDVASCSDSPEQVWLKDNAGYINPNSGLCMAAPSEGQGQLLNLQNCSDMSSSKLTWTSSVDYRNYTCSGVQASMVACNAVKEWINWQANPNGHEALLTNYTGGAAYEEWCADFVSYVFREAGYPFSSGNYSGWDENIASQVQNQGFTYHAAGSYVPQPGDVAFFDYPGGHVEIVVSGGIHPTFVFGNSAVIDPTTGNGEMAANTILNDPSLGQVQYYLTPNSST